MNHVCTASIFTTDNNDKIFYFVAESSLGGIKSGGEISASCGKSV